MDNYTVLRETLLHAAKKAFDSGLFSGTSGNLSLRDATGAIAITPSGVRYEGMDADDILVVSKLGEIILGKEGRSPSSEMPMHLEIFRKMGDVNAIVHTHSPYATSFAAGGRGIPAALIEMVYFLGGDIKVAPFALPGTAELGLSAVGALLDRGACLLENHGVVAVGGDMERAYLRAEYAEDAAKICLFSALGGGIKPISDEDLAKMKEGR